MAAPALLSESLLFSARWTVAETFSPLRPLSLTPFTPPTTAGAARAHRGPITAVIFDFAGTIVDYGSSAPVSAFQEVFRREGVVIDSVSSPVAIGPKAISGQARFTELARHRH
jgi:hypothetical protein